MPILSLVKVRNFAVSQCWARAQNALFVRKIVENHILFVLKMPILVPSSHSLTTFCTKGSFGLSASIECLNRGFHAKVAPQSTNLR